MMMVVKRKQIVVLSLVLLIVVAAYLQYSFRKDSVSVSSSDNARLGEAAYVDENTSDDQMAAGSQTAAEQSKAGTQAAGETGKSVPAPDTKSTKTSKASKEASAFFAQARLDKETERGKNTDALNEIKSDGGTDQEVMAQASEKLMNLINLSDKEMRIETLIKEKGYEDALAMFADDGSVDIIVKAPTLNSSEIAQISDIVSRQANIPIGNMHIRNLY